MINKAQKCIKKNPIPSSLEQEFKNSGLESLLGGVYGRTAELLEENQDASKALVAHLKIYLLIFYKKLDLLRNLIKILLYN